MFGFHKIKNNSPVQNDSTEKIAVFIVHKALKLQEDWATFMHRKTSNYSRGTIRLSVIFFCCFGVGVNLYFIIKGASNTSEKLLTIERIRKPTHFPHSREESGLSPEPFSNEYTKVMLFKKYLDSLDKSTEGRKIRNHILNQRPGLLDSVLQLEQYYQLQLNIKK